MKFVLFLALIVIACTASSISEILEGNATDFFNALQAADSALVNDLNTTSACPCNVFDAYALEQVPVFNETFADCMLSNDTTKCFKDNVCVPFKTLAANPCGGYFMQNLEQYRPKYLQLINALVGACPSVNVSISINATCQADQVVDYTVFAVNSSLEDNLVQYHVVKNAYAPANLFGKNFVESVYQPNNRTQYVEVIVVDSNGTTSVSVVTNFVTQARANVTRSFPCSNGFVHMLSSPMSLPLAPSAVFNQHPYLSNLSSEIGVAFDEIVNLTLLAPANSGFAAFPFYTNLTDRLKNLTINSHRIVDLPTVFSTDVITAAGEIINTSSGLQLQIQVEDGAVSFVAPADSRDLAYVVQTDIVTTNGVIHIVDAVLRPVTVNPQDNTIVDNLYLDERVESFVSLVAQSAPQFLESIKNASNITLFAFQTVPSGNGTNGSVGIDELGALLDYHTLRTEVLATDLEVGKNLVATSLVDGQYVQLDNGTQSLFVVVADTSDPLVQLQSSYPADNVNITYADLRCAGNSVIHVVSAPAKIPANTVSTLLDGGFVFLGESFGNQTEFANMINGVLPNEFNNKTSVYTVFVAQDSAYSSLSAEANLTELSVLQDQVVEGRSLAAGIAAVLNQSNNSFSLTMLSGRNVTVELRDGDIYVAGWKVVATDILTSNGVIHVLEGAVGATPSDSKNALSPGVIAAIIVGGVAFLGLLCYCFFMKGEDGSDEESQPFARIP